MTKRTPFDAEVAGSRAHETSDERGNEATDGNRLLCSAADEIERLTVKWNAALRDRNHWYDQTVALRMENAHLARERDEQDEARANGAMGAARGARRPSRPRIVCLCGSTRFGEAFRKANLDETLAGRIVLTVGCDFKSDDALGLAEDVKGRLDELHKRKIDLADEVLVLNVGGYIGASTQGELAYAVANGKGVRFLEEGDNALERA